MKIFLKYVQACVYLYITQTFILDVINHDQSFDSPSKIIK